MVNIAVISTHQIKENNYWLYGQASSNLKALKAKVSFHCAVDWMFLSPPSFVCWNSTLSVVVFGDRNIERQLGHEGRTLMNGIKCSYKRDTRETPCPFCHVRIAGRQAGWAVTRWMEQSFIRQIPYLLVAGSCTSSFQNCEDKFLWCIRHPVLLCYSSLNWLRYSESEEILPQDCSINFCQEFPACQSPLHFRLASPPQSCEPIPQFLEIISLMYVCNKIYWACFFEEHWQIQVVR